MQLRTVLLLRLLKILNERLQRTPEVDSTYAVVVDVPNKEPIVVASASAIKARPARGNLLSLLNLLVSLQPLKYQLYQRNQQTRMLTLLLKTSR